jgi:TonB family protein
MNIRGRFAVLALTGSIALGPISTQLSAQENAANFDRVSRTTVAIDSNGVRHRGADYEGGVLPWMREAAKGRPFYPYEARRLHHEGIAVLRCSLDLSTGKIVGMSVIKSSGSPILDEGARKTLASWKWPPGRWKEVEIPVEFKLSKGTSGPEIPRPGHKPTS